MTPPSWYYPLLYLWFRILAWIPVVRRRGTVWDLEESVRLIKSFNLDALDALEHHGEDGLHSARSLLYLALEV